MWKIAAETTSIELNLQDPSPSSSYEYAQFLANFFDPELDLQSMMIKEHEYAIKFKCYVKNFQIWNERVFGGNLDLDLESEKTVKFCYDLIYIWSLNHIQIKIRHELIMISENEVHD